MSQTSNVYHPKFAPCWYDTLKLFLNDLELTYSAALLFLAYRSSIDSPETRISVKTDTQIEKDLKMNRTTIRTARKMLIEKHLIRRENYHSFFVYHYERRKFDDLE